MSALEMLGSVYESSDSETDNEDNNYSVSRVKNFRKPSKLPLPQVFTSVNENSDITNDPSKHQGRMRSFAHERGNWATCVFLPYPIEHVVQFKQCIEKIVCKNNGVQWNFVDDIHLSLSKTVPIPHHFIDPFVESLQEKFSVCQSFAINLFSSELQYYVNDEKSRSFCGFQISNIDTKSRIKEIVDKVDETLSDFRCETYYENPSYHISIAWCLGDINKVKDGEKFVDTLKEELSCLESDECEHLFSFQPSKIVMKTGNKRYSFPLSAR